jgi:putative membrane protein
MSGVYRYYSRTFHKPLHIMALEITLRYIHFISIFAIVGSLVSEHLLLKKTMTRGELGHVARIDAVYGIAAVTLLTAAP